MLFNLVFSRFYAVFYDLSSLGNFYSFSVDKIVLTLLVGSCTLCVYTLCSRGNSFFEIFLFLSADENSNIDIGSIKVFIVVIIIIITIIIVKDYR